VLDQQLELPNQNGALNADIERSFIEELAVQLGIDPEYISISQPSNDGDLVVLRQRALSAGLALKITILSDDSGTLATTLAALTSDPSFWQGVNARIVDGGATTTFNSSGIVVQDAVLTCNENFKHNNVTGSCIAVPMSCDAGKYAAAGTGKCATCATGRYSAGGVGECSSCAPGQNSHRGASRCQMCPSGYFQSDSKNTDDGEQSRACRQCPWGKYQNAQGSVYCEEVLNNHLLVMTAKKGYEQRQCPRLGVLCENNTKRYAGTHWHNPQIISPNCTVPSRFTKSFSSYNDLQCTKMYACVNQGCPDAGASQMECKPG
jgi:hypothetical protein